MIGLLIAADYAEARHAGLPESPSHFHADLALSQVVQREEPARFGNFAGGTRARGPSLLAGR